jgi:hypothetical protein
VSSHDSSSQDPHDEEQVRHGRGLAVTWYLWPLAVLLVIMLIGWLTSR